MATPGIFWLTRDFRFSDNPALTAAMSEGPLLAVFLVDGALRAQGSASRWRLERAIRAFDVELRRRSGTGLLVVEGEAEEVVPRILAQTGARRIHQSDWPAPQMRAVQQRLRESLKGEGGLVLHPGHLLTHPRNIRTGAGGVYRVFTPFARALRSHGPDRPTAPAPERITPARVDLPDLRILDVDTLNLAPDMYRGRAVLDRFALPAGEAAAFARLDDFLDRVQGYADNRDRPDIDATSGLSEHLALGEISPRSIWSIAEQRAEGDARVCTGIAKFLSEVIWREFAWHLLIDFPQMAERPWRAEWQDFPWQGPGADLTGWIRGDTGVALVDAGLREMQVTGRMHNRVRMVVASWLTKHLMTDWRLGLRHFEDSLTDWDPAANAMNWQWVAGCGPDASPFFRIFNPEKQAAQYDPRGRYRARWLAGWEGLASSGGEEARAYLQSLPSDWTVPGIWRRGDEAALERGRKRALDQYQAFRGTGSASDD